MFKRALGFIWASPISVIGLSITCLATLVGWCRWHARHGDAFVWVISDDAPKRIKDAFFRRGGATFGNITIVRNEPNTYVRALTLRHEQEHVVQYMRLGVFQPVAFAIAYVCLAFTRNGHPFYDNPFEIDARRAAGQVIDVIGVAKRLSDKKRKHKVLNDT